MARDRKPGSLPAQLRLLTRHSDLLLAGMVVGVVAMMIIPLPTPLLDILITTNISLAVILLLVSIYVSDSLRIAALPSILLITTLFRLGLNVSSTRLILLEADAGRIIGAFGTAMAEEGINIANFILGRTKPGGDAVTLLELDRPLKASVMKKARALESVIEVTPLHFPAMEQKA